MRQSNTRFTSLINVKQSNYQNIYSLFFSYERLSKPQISQLLDLSLPTVTNNISKLEKEGKIRKQGVLESQGGRPATAYTLVSDAFIALGVEIQKYRIKLTALNLKMEMIAFEELHCTFFDTPDYLEQLSATIAQFIDNQGYNEQQILGIGISIQAIVAKDHRSILYSKIINFDHLNIDHLQSVFKPRVSLFHDVKCAAGMEIWQTQYTDNAFYVYISEHLGGAFILNNKIELGKNGFSGALEHIQLNQEGKQCYCGQYGCLETYCSLSALLKPNEPIEQFFADVRSNKQSSVQRWQKFLHHLALGLKSVYLLLEHDIILGGDIAPYLINDDISILEKEIQQIYSFSLESGFIKIARLLQHSTVCGAALPFIIQYLENKLDLI